MGMASAPSAAAIPAALPKQPTNQGMPSLAAAEGAVAAAATRFPASSTVAVPCADEFAAASAPTQTTSQQERCLPGVSSREGDRTSSDSPPPQAPQQQQPGEVSFFDLLRDLDD